MVEKNEEVKVKENGSEGKGGASKLLDLMAKAIGVIGNMPKALMGILLMVSLLGGATGVYGTLMPNGDDDKHNAELYELENRILILEIENKLQHELILRTLAVQGVLNDDIILKSFLIELPSGKVTPLD